MINLVLFTYLFPFLIKSFSLTMIVCLIKTFMLLRYYYHNYDKIRNQETPENYPRIGY